MQLINRYYLIKIKTVLEDINGQMLEEIAVVEDRD